MPSLLLEEVVEQMLCSIVIGMVHHSRDLLSVWYGSFFVSATIALF
jgi:hypothetical protein